MTFKKFGAFVVGVAVIGGAGYAGWTMNQGKGLPFFGPKEKESLLAKGTSVDLLLLEGISSGGSEKGDKVGALVGTDIKDSQGYLLVKAGSPAVVEVTRSRGATAMTQVINQPARLSIRYLTMLAVDGKEVKLAVDQAAKEEDIDVTREMVSRGGVDDALAKMWSHPETQAPLKALAEKLNGTNPNAELKAPDLTKVLGDVAKDMKMPATSDAIKNPAAWSALSDAAQKVGKGDLSSLSTADAALALGALNELGKLAGSMGDTFEGMFKGRNIVAPVGSRLTAYVAEGVKVKAVPAP